MPERSRNNQRHTVGVKDKISIYRSNHISSINGTLDPMAGPRRMCLDCEQCGKDTAVRGPICKIWSAREGIHTVDEGEKIIEALLWKQ
jgi:hypothetical protein